MPGVLTEMEFTETEIIEMSKQYRVVLRESASGTVSELLEARAMLIRSGALERLIALKPAMRPEEFHFLLFSMAPPQEELQKLACQLAADTRIIFRTTIVAECEREITELHENAQHYMGIDEIDIPF